MGHCPLPQSSEDNEGAPAISSQICEKQAFTPATFVVG